MERRGPRFGRARRVLALLWIGLFWLAPVAAEPTPVRIGVLQFGTVKWELAAIERLGLLRDADWRLEPQDFTGVQASKIALQAGAVELIVADWVWVARQRAAGHDLAFVPYSSAVASLVVPEGSPIGSLRDLAGTRLGIAGGPLDKTWLLLQALAAREAGLELKASLEPVYGAPPLLNRQIEAGRIDAVINYWHFVARLEAAGMRRLLGADQIVARLGIDSTPPLLGFVFKRDWAARHPQLIAELVTASRTAKARLCDSEPLWREIAPLTRAESDAVLAALRTGFCEGVPQRWSAAERASAAAIFGILAGVGGEELVGDATALDPLTFWPGVDF